MSRYVAQFFGLLPWGAHRWERKNDVVRRPVSVVQGASDVSCVCSHVAATFQPAVGHEFLYVPRAPFLCPLPMQVVRHILYQLGCHCVCDCFFHCWFRAHRPVCMVLCQAPTRRSPASDAGPDGSVLHIVYAMSGGGGGDGHQAPLCAIIRTGLHNLHRRCSASDAHAIK